MCTSRCMNTLHFPCGGLSGLCKGLHYSTSNAVKYQIMQWNNLTATDVVWQDIIIRVVVHVDDSTHLNKFVFIVKLVQYSYSGNYLHFVQVVFTRGVTVLFVGLIKSWSCCSTMSQLCVDCLFANMWCWNVIANSSFPV